MTDRLHPIYDWITSNTPGLRDALDALVAAEAAVRDVTPTYTGRPLAQIGIRTSSTEWKPKPGVAFGELDAARVADELYRMERQRAGRRAQAAKMTADGLLWGSALGQDERTQRQSAAAARVSAIDITLARERLLAAEVDELNAERIVAERWAFTTSPGALESLASGVGTVTMWVPAMETDPQTGETTPSKTSRVQVTMTPHGIGPSRHFEPFQIRTSAR